MTQETTQAVRLNASEPTPLMIEAGVHRLRSLLDAGVGSAYVVEQVFEAMLAADNPSEGVQSFDESPAA